MRSRTKASGVEIRHWDHWPRLRTLPGVEGAASPEVVVIACGHPDGGSRFGVLARMTAWK
jgi:hypothetical protein